MYYLRQFGFPNVSDPCTSVPSGITHQQNPLLLPHCEGWKKPLPSQIGLLTIVFGGNFEIYDLRIWHGPSWTVLNTLATKVTNKINEKNGIRAIQCKRAADLVTCKVMKKYQTKVGNVCKNWLWPAKAWKVIHGYGNSYTLTANPNE